MALTPARQLNGNNDGQRHMHMQKLRFTPLLLGATLCLTLGCSDDSASSEDSNGATSNSTSGGTSGGTTGGGTGGTTFTEGDTDLVDYTCQDPGWAPGDAGDSTIDETPCDSAQHVPEPVEVTYSDNPAACGAHRPQWGKWGEYEFLPPQRYIHNLEHGGIALLYHPCADAATVDALRDYARARPADDGGDFRWVLTPAPDLPTAIAVLAWGHRYQANAVDEAAIESFVSDTYRTSSEDIGSNGSYERLWIGD